MPTEPIKRSTAAPAIVAIGASAGGLEGWRQMFAVLPAAPDLAFILVRQLNPIHDSLLAELLATHTLRKVLQAAEGMAIEAEHLYVIPPGSALCVSQPGPRLDADPGDSQLSAWTPRSCCVCAVRLNESTLRHAGGTFGAGRPQKRLRVEDHAKFTVIAAHRRIWQFSWQCSALWDQSKDFSARLQELFSYYSAKPYVSSQI